MRKQTTVTVKQSKFINKQTKRLIFYFIQKKNKREFERKRKLSPERGNGGKEGERTIIDPVGINKRNKISKKKIFKTNSSPHLNGV